MSKMLKVKKQGALVKPRKKLSGAQYRKRAKEKKKEADMMASLVNQWTQKDDDVRERLHDNHVGDVAEEFVDTDDPMKNDDDKDEDSENPDDSAMNNTDNDEGITEECEVIVKSSTKATLDYQDPSTWPPILNEIQKRFIINMRAKHPEEPDLSSSYRYGRNLTKEWFHKTLPNGQKIPRSWLAYSKTQNSLYCISCKLFTNYTKSSSTLVKQEGFTHWKKLSDRIPEHENSLQHRKWLCELKKFESNFWTLGVDKEYQDRLTEETNHWRSVLQSILKIILHMAKDGYLLKCLDEVTNVEVKDESKDNGKYWNIVKLISEYHYPLKEHLSNHRKGLTKYFYNEVISEFTDLMSLKLRHGILVDIREAKYFTIMLDCILEVGKPAPIAQIIRYVKVGPYGCTIVESFLGFITQTDNQELTDIVLKSLERDGLGIKNCVAQSYDNSVNMVNKYTNLTAGIHEQNQLAIFVPSYSQSLNEAVVNAIMKFRDIEDCFGTIQRFFGFFSASSYRWEILTSHVKISLKSQPHIRWPANFDAVEIINTQLERVMAVLNTFKYNPLSNEETKSEAGCILSKVSNLKFVLMLSFWYRILSHIDGANKIIQNVNITVNDTVENISNLLNTIDSERANICSDISNEAETIAETYDIDPLKDVYIQPIMKKVNIDNEKQEKPFVFDNLKAILIEIIDTIVENLNERLISITKIKSLFSFVHGKELNNYTVDILRSQATNLALLYKSNMDAKEIIVEVESFKQHVLKLDPNLNNATPLQLLNFIYKNKLHGAYPNMATALRIYLTMPITATEDLSKMIAVKNFIRKNMDRNIVSSLSILNIEHEQASRVNYEEVIDMSVGKITNNAFQVKK